MKVEAGEVHVRGLGDFDIALGPVNDVDIVTYALDETRFVGGVYAILHRARERFFQQRDFEDLRCLREDQTFPWNRGGYQRDVFGQTPAFYFLYRVHGGDGEDGSFAVARFLDDASNVFYRDEGTHGVVYNYKFCFG